jgi:hypothetical protein
MGQVRMTLPITTRTKGMIINMTFNELADSILNEANLDAMSPEERDAYEAELDKKEAYKAHLDGSDLEPESGPNEAFKHLESALDAFYALGRKGLGADAAAVNDRVYNMLQQREVDQRDIKRFADALTSIILGQSVRGYAVSQD